MAAPQTVAGTSSSTTHLYQDNRLRPIAVTAVDNNGVVARRRAEPGEHRPGFW